MILYARRRNKTNAEFVKKTNNPAVSAEKRKSVFGGGRQAVTFKQAAYLSPVQYICQIQPDDRKAEGKKRKQRQKQSSCPQAGTPQRDFYHVYPPYINID